MTPSETPQQSEGGLSLEEGKLLVQTARLAVTRYLKTKDMMKAPEDAPEKLRRQSGVFATLNTAKPPHELRGCIGFPYPGEPLVEATIKAAIYATTEDPRFSPVSLDEFTHSIILELTVLTQPEALKTRDRKSLPNLIQVGRHGLIVEGMGTSGLLLPQVATEWNWDSTEFLTNCCLKASLPPDSWLLDGVEVKVFEGEIFEELAPAGEIKKKTIGGR